jgi:hypothetical protein
VGIYRRLSFPLFHPADYRLGKKKYDALFLLYDFPLWQSFKLVLDELNRTRPDLKLRVAFSGSRDELPDFLKSAGIPTITNVKKYLPGIFDTKILYTPQAFLYEFLSTYHKPPKAVLVHALMSMNSIDGGFTEDAFDMYDYILCAGSHHVDSFRKLALRRHALSGKWLVPAGYPKLDLMLAAHSTKRRPPGSSARSTIVYAPTHIFEPNERLVSLRHYGETIVSTLLAEGYRVIFRPHGSSFFDQDRFVVERICQRHAGNPNFCLDARGEYIESYSSADLMVTDVSGTGFTFSFGFGRPTIFFAPNAEAERGLSGIQFEGRHRIGAVVRSVDQMIAKASELCCSNMTNQIAQFRDETIFNVGKSAAYIASCLEDIHSGRERPEWIRL